LLWRTSGECLRKSRRLSPMGRGSMRVFTPRAS
jgi:hypothetical protein